MPGIKPIVRLELTVWFIPSIIENGIAASIIGLVLGPMFPLLLTHIAHILPSTLVIETVGIVTGIGITGSAAFPLITGLLSSSFGIKSVQPLVVSMMVVMVSVWAFVPTGPDISDTNQIDINQTAIEKV
uniref:Uncharacterized protein n=1 Tax=Psilocybe cubensis TaxID=181762 RepID=A0A8H7XPT8_PSICU